MDGNQLTIWTEEYLNKVAPRIKTPSEIKKEKIKKGEKDVSESLTFGH